MTIKDRRDFLKHLAAATSGIVVLPMTVSCGGSTTTGTDPEETATTGGVELLETVTDVVPLTRPQGWDPVAFNTARGAAGSIPESYMVKINAPDGVEKHLGKHLPYVPTVDPALVPEGYLALMWGDPEKGYAMHPQSPEGTESYPLGHWYNWIKVRKAVGGEVEELESVFTAWPGSAEGDTGLFVAADGGDLSDNSGKNTVYLVKLPADLVPGDEVRIYAHCLYHGEYVDFLTV